MTPKSKKTVNKNDGYTNFQVPDDDIPSQPNNLEVGLDLIHLALTEPYLTPDQCTEFTAISIHSLNPEYREDAKARFLKLYPRSPVIDAKMRVQIADAAIALVQAMAAHGRGETDAAQTLMQQASAILPKLEKRRIHQRDKLAAQEECIRRFAERLLDIRPKGGWDDIDQAARVGQIELQVLLKKYKRTFGLLWKMDSGALVLQWLQQKQPYVHNAYQGMPIRSTDESNAEPQS